jgi:serine-type D-Ala-D-Ala carboxypeptidase/endopeptidase (penicillin-binding protein 4)
MIKNCTPYLVFLILAIFSACKSKAILMTQEASTVIKNHKVDSASQKTIPAQRERRALTLYDSIPNFDNSFTGFVFMDLDENKIIASKNAEQYYRPASNTKILTLYAALNELDDTINFANIYRHSSGVEVLRPLGDPTFDHPLYENCGLKFEDITSKYKIIDLSHWDQTEYGKGWMWDDFDYIYTLPLSPMPIYGNRLFVGNGEKEIDLFPKNHDYILKSNPQVQSVDIRGDTLVMPLNTTIFESTQVPLKNINKIVKSSFLTNKFAASELIYQKTIKSCPIDTVLKYMMHESDNFLAEQMLLQVGQKLNLKMNTAVVIDSLNKKYFKANSYPPKWVDGSGLSHYNLVNPTFITQLLTELWKNENRAELLTYFPSGGTQGTLRSWFKNAEGKAPYVFAKSGTISNVYCLSGYLFTNTSRPIAFSIMSNNFLGSSSPIKKDIETLLEFIRDYR